MLGRIGFGPNLLGGFPNGGGLAPLNRGVVGRRRRAQRDGRNLSQDLIKRMQVERQLKTRLKQVTQAQANGQDPTAARQALAAEYGAAKGQGVEIDSRLDQAVQKVLGKKGVEQALKGANGVNNMLKGLNNNFGGGGGANGGGGGGAGGGGGGNLGATNLNGGGGFGGGGGVNHTPRPMSAADHQNLSDALQMKGKDAFNNLFDGWRQTREGNCASVAAIKAAMKEYGADMFKDVQRNENGYQVTLQDGKQLSLSNDEMAYLRGQAQFSGTDPKALALAELGYGVIAKNHAMTHNVSLQSATHDLNNGFDPRQSARLLGLGDKMTQFNGRDGVVWNNAHAVFKGGAYDLWGRPVNGFGGHSAYSFLQGMPSQRFTTTMDGGGQTVQPAQESQSQSQAGTNDQASVAATAEGDQVAAAEESSTVDDTSPQLASAEPASTDEEELASAEGGGDDMQLADAGDGGGGEAGGEAPETPPETAVA